MDYIKINKVGVVIKELLVSFELTHNEWETIKKQVDESYLKQSGKVTLPKEKGITTELGINNDTITSKITLL